MADDPRFEIRPGRIGDRRGARRTFVGDALAAATRAGGLAGAQASLSSRFGRGRAAGLAVRHARAAGARGAVVKARVVRTPPRPGALALHVRYLQRDGVTKDGEPGRLFDPQGEAADGGAFAERCADDRHHFRFIVSPDDGEQMSDLKAFTRELMDQAQKDLGTRLDWVAIDHWNTGHPHVHILVRGRADDGADLVISRDYISHGLRARAGELVQLELGPRSQREIAERLARQVEADRWTDLDRGLRRLAGEEGVIDLRPHEGRTREGDQPRIARLRKLEAMGLASAEGVGRWRLSPEAEPTLRAMGREGDVIARLHAAMSGRGGALDPADLELASSAVVGRLAARGHDDELRGSAYAAVEGIDGRLHHVALRTLDDASDAPIGGLVELRALENGRQVLSVRSDLSLEGQVTARGATWLDRRLIAKDGAEGLADRGFGQEVREALVARGEHLVSEGLARRRGVQLIFARDLLASLRERELEDIAAGLARRSGLSRLATAPGEAIEGVYARRIEAASGRFAVIEGALGFQLVPWRPDLERRLGQNVAGVMGDGGRIDWTHGRKPGLQI
jgi:type IV secretory pathway VirD2 relaxase